MQKRRSTICYEIFHEEEHPLCAGLHCTAGTTVILKFGTSFNKHTKGSLLPALKLHNMEVPVMNEKLSNRQGFLLKQVK